MAKTEADRRWRQSDHGRAHLRAYARRRDQVARIEAQLAELGEAVLTPRDDADAEYLVERFRAEHDVTVMGRRVRVTKRKE